MAHGTHADLSDPLWRTDNMLQLVALVGPDLAAQLRPADDTEFLKRMTAFAKNVSGMSDDEIREQWGAGDELLATFRELQTSCGL